MIARVFSHFRSSFVLHDWLRYFAYFITNSWAHPMIHPQNKSGVAPNQSHLHLSIHDHSAIRLRGLRQFIRPAKRRCITQEILKQMKVYVKFNGWEIKFWKCCSQMMLEGSKFCNLFLILGRKIIWNSLYPDYNSRHHSARRDHVVMTW